MLCAFSLQCVSTSSCSWINSSSILHYSSIHITYLYDSYTTQYMRLIFYSYFQRYARHMELYHLWNCHLIVENVQCVSMLHVHICMTVEVKLFLYTFSTLQCLLNKCSLFVRKKISFLLFFFHFIFCF